MASQGRGTGKRGATWSGILALMLAGSSILYGAGAPVFNHHAKESKDAALADPQKAGPSASQAPAFSIPVEPLGFFAPGAIYRGQRESLVSLDFLDEDHLLFTFHTPGLIRREGNRAAANARQVRAVVLKLPAGDVEAEALWTLHDRGRYLWMLKDGHFLMRDQNDLKLGDSSLELKPSLHFRGPLLWVETNASQDLLVAESLEPADEKPKAGEGSTRAGEESSEEGDPEDQRDIVLRILNSRSRQILIATRTRKTLHLPINTEGFVETLPGKGHEWTLTLKDFRGGSHIIGTIDSMCAPSVEFVSNAEVVVSACNPDTSRWIVAMSTDGKRLWNLSKPATQIWPRLIMAPNGLRLARETLLSNHAVNTYSPISFDDIKGQLVEVYNASTGKTELTAPANPILDGGGNVAFSPSARRVAILNAGAIQVYELPDPVFASPSAH